MARFFLIFMNFKSGCVFYLAYGLMFLTSSIFLILIYLMLESEGFLEFLGSGVQRFDKRLVVKRFVRLI